MFVDWTEPNSYLPIPASMVLTVKTLKGKKLLDQVHRGVKRRHRHPIAESGIGNRIEKCPIMVGLDLVFRGAWHKLESMFLRQKRYGGNRNRPRAI